MVDGKELAQAMMGKSKKKSRKKYADGGTVTGDSSKPRLDKKSRDNKKGTHVNVIIAGNPQAAQQDGLAKGMMLGRATAQAAPPVPGVGVPPRPMGPPPGMPPQMPQGAGMGMPPQQPPMGRKEGGRIPHLDAGAGGGKGRLEKAAFEKKNGK